MIRKSIHIILAVLNLVDAFMLDSALRSFGIPSEWHILHHYSKHLNLILALRIFGSLLIVYLTLKAKRISNFNTILGLVALFMASKMIHDNYMYLILE